MMNWSVDLQGLEEIPSEQANVVEEEISDVDLYRRVIISTNSQYITMCIPN